jgi:hypothetical protein
LRGPAPELLPASNPNGGLVVDSSELDFGEVWEQQRTTVPVTVRNPTNRGVEIDGWSGWNRTDISPRRVAIPAGGSAMIQIQFDPALGRSTSDLSELFEIEQQFKPWIVSEPGQHPGWTLTGRVKRAVSVSSGYLELSKEPLLRSEEFPTESVRVIALRPIQSLTAVFDPKQLEVRISNPDSRNGYDVSVTPADTVSSGGRTFFVVLQAELTDGTVVETDFEVQVNIE